MISDSVIVKALESSDSTTIIDALYDLGAMEDRIPSKSVFDAALRHLESRSDEVRRTVAYAVGIHFGYRPAFDVFVKHLAVEHEDYVVGAIVSALSRIAQIERSLGPSALDALRKVFFGAPQQSRLRHRAIIEAKRLCGMIGIAEYASSRPNPTEAVVGDLWWDNAHKELMARLSVPSRQE